MILFLLLVMGLGFLSYKKLMNFYINKETDYNDWTPDLGTKFETDIASTFYNKFGFVNLNGALCNFLKQPAMNGVVKLNNGYLFIPVSYSSDNILHEYADATIRFSEYLKNRGTALVYAATPGTSSKYDPQLPVGISHYENDNLDRFLQMIQQGRVDTIDFRQTMHDDGINQYDMMYKTDHHWTTKAGFYAYGILEDYIVRKTGCEVDEQIADINNYTIITYKKWHLGSRGQRTGIYYTGIDDFDLILPNFKTILQNTAGKVGSMQDLMINMKPLVNKDYTSKDTYDFVLGGTLGSYINLNSKNDIKILIITDSFGRAVNPYLAMGFKEIQYVYKSDVSDIVNPNFIDDYDPDVVIMMYCSQNLLNDTFSFNGF